MRARLVCNRYTTGYRSVSPVHGNNLVNILKKVLTNRKSCVIMYKR